MINWPWNKKKEENQPNSGEPDLEERLDNIEDFLYRAEQQNQDAGDVGIRISCIDRSIATLVNHDSIVKIEPETIIKYANIYYTYIIKDVPSSDNQ